MSDQRQGRRQGAHGGERGLPQAGEGEGRGDGDSAEHRGVAETQRRAHHAARGRVYSLLFLASVTEPDPDNLLLHREVVSQHGNFLRGRLGVLEESPLERHSHARLDRGPLLPTAAHVVGRGEGVAQRGGVRHRLVRVLQPLLQQRLQLAHVLEGEVEGLEATDGGLREVVAVELAHGQTHVALCEAQLDAPLLERLGELLQLLEVRGLLRGRLPVARGRRGVR